MSVVDSSLVSVSSNIANPKSTRMKPCPLRRDVPQGHKWSFKHPVLSLAPAKKKARRKKRDKPCALCVVTETLLWRTWPTDRQVMLCNACEIKVRTPGVVLPELVYLSPLARVGHLHAPAFVGAPHEIQLVSDSPGAVHSKQVQLHLPSLVMTMMTVIFELQQPHPQEIQESEYPPNIRILDSMIDADI